MSWRRVTLFSVNESVGPCGRCEMIIASAERGHQHQGDRDGEKRRTRDTTVFMNHH